MRSASRIDLLRLSLLASMGFTASACGGETMGQPGEGAGGSGAGAGGSASSVTGGRDGAGGSYVFGDGGGSPGGGTGVGGSVGGSGGSAELVWETPGICSDPEALVEGEETGFVRCSEGFTERREAVKCPWKLPREGLVASNPPPEDGLGGANDGGMFDECSSDEDCAEDLSYCGENNLGPGGPLPWRSCMTGCREDSDCGDGMLCHCGADYGRCVVANCSSTDDCEPGFLCAGFVQEVNICGGNVTPTFSCQTANDECYDSSDCVEKIDAAGGTYHCVRNEQAQARCYVENAVCGRPFLVQSEARLALAVEGKEWLLSEGEKLASASHLSPEERAALKAHFQGIALMEHASVAAFARFTLQLLSLGAPCRFIEASNQAQVDETHHARLCFSLASRFSDKPVAAGPLAIDGALLDSSMEAILRTTIIEGCIGETLASMEAAFALERCKDDQARVALEIIVDDEARHAELAWGVVQWMLEQRPELRAAAESAFAEGIQSRRPHSESPEDDLDLTRFGVLGSSELRSLHHKALAEIVEPCAQQLLSSVEEGAKAQVISAQVAPASV